MVELGPFGGFIFLRVQKFTEYQSSIDNANIYYNYCYVAGSRYRSLMTKLTSILGGTFL